MSQRKQAAEEALKHLRGQPMRLSELHEATGISPIILCDSMYDLKKQGAACSFGPNAGYKCRNGVAIYYLPEDRDLAWIKYSKMNRLETQRMIDKENGVLKLAAEKVLISTADCAEAGISVSKDYMRCLIYDEIVEELHFYNFPKTWKGPRKSPTYYYLAGREKDAARKIADWILPLPPRPYYGGVRGIVYLLSELPPKVENEVRKMIDVFDWKGVCRSEIEAYRKRRKLRQSANGSAP